MSVIKIKEEEKTTMMSGRHFYKPFQYPWAYDLWLQHENIHWLPSETSFAPDVRDWQKMLSEEEKNFLTQLFRFFTQADVQVNGAYAGIFLPAFHKTPELAMLMSGIAAREAVHVDAYSKLLETVGMPEVEYSAFLEYEEMLEKYDYVAQFDASTPEGLAKCCAVYGAFVEGIQLFSSFAMLMNFGRYGKMSGMIDIVSWSQRDEGVHCDALIGCYHQLTKEFPIDKQKLNLEVKQIGIKMSEMEKKFIDLAFELGGIEGLTPDEMKKYVEFLCDWRLGQLGIVPHYGVSTNPLPWVDEIVNGKEHANFFERTGTEYSKGAMTGEVSDDDYDDMF